MNRFYSVFEIKGPSLGICDRTTHGGRRNHTINRTHSTLLQTEPLPVMPTDSKLKSLIFRRQYLHTKERGFTFVILIHGFKKLPYGNFGHFSTFLFEYKRKQYTRLIDLHRELSLTQSQIGLPSKNVERSF